MKKVLGLAAVMALVLGFVAPAFADVEQINVEKIKTFMQKESDRSGFSASSASAHGAATDTGNWYRDKLIGGFHFGPAGSDDKSSHTK